MGIIDALITITIFFNIFFALALWQLFVNVRFYFFSYRVYDSSQGKRLLYSISKKILYTVLVLIFLTIFLFIFIALENSSNVSDASIGAIIGLGFLFMTFVFILSLNRILYKKSTIIDINTYKKSGTQGFTTINEIIMKENNIETNKVVIKKPIIDNNLLFKSFIPYVVIFILLTILNMSYAPTISMIIGVAYYGYMYIKKYDIK